MQSKQTVISVLILIIVLGFIAFLFSATSKISKTDNEVPAVSSVAYNNTDYGFTFSLPLTWKGYSIVESTWRGSSATVADGEAGPMIAIRNPNWTEAIHHEDIPVVIFTIAQWNSYVAEEFSVFAAPFPASELGRNNLYVFALPPRWDYDYSVSFEEAQTIVKENTPLQTYDVIEK